MPILPRQTIIDLRYSQIRSESEIRQARLELTKHGFNSEQIESIDNGSAIPDISPEYWMRALVTNGFWTTEAQELFGVLPDNIKNQGWTIATVAELSATGLVQVGLIPWLRKLGDNFGSFLEIAALLQRGYSVEDLQLLYDLNALQPIVKIMAPGAGIITDWNVETVDIKSGSRVVAGEQLLTLLNPRAMYLRTDPVGAEAVDVLQCIANATTCEAIPLVRDSGPRLTGFHVDFLQSDSGGHGTIAFATVQNSVLATASRHDRMVFRSWSLRSGLKYILRVPTKRIENVFVLPSSAVTDDGHSKVVFISDGESFKQIDVEIAYQDNEVAVIAINKESKLFPGDQVVISGAFPLGLALKTGQSKADPHAGHNH